MRKKEKEKRVNINTLFISHTERVHTINKMSENSSSIKRPAKVAKLINNPEENEDINMDEGERKESEEYVKRERKIHTKKTKQSKE